MAGDKKITELPIASAVNGNEPIEIVQGGVSKQSLLSVVATYIKTVVGNLFDSVRLSPSYEPVSTEEGEIYWNGKYYTPQYDTGLGVTIRDGDTEYWVFYNDLGVTIPAGKIMHLLSGFTFDGETYPTYEYADSSTWEKVQGTLAMTMHSVSPSSLGILAKSSQKIPTDTSGVSAASQLWISDDGSGDFTDTPPSFPSIPISIGASYDSDVNGSVFFNQTTSFNEIYNDAWDGAILETFNFTTSSNGTTVTGTLQNTDPTRDLPIKFSGSLYTFDTTPAATVTLTPGTDGNETTNYVYIPKSTKVLTVSTSGWPTDEHARIAQLEIQSAATTQTDGGTLGNQNTNDHLKTTGDNGHILHIAAWIRKQFATFESGTEASFDNTGGNGYISISAGVANQMHEQALGSFGMPTDSIRVWNDNGGLRPKITNLTSITAYSDGSTWNNEWGKIVVWRVVNKSGEYAPVMFNLPSGGYNSESSALEDLQQKADYSIPNNFKTKAILIATFTFRISGGVITYNTGYENLRGQIPITVAGGGGGAGVTTLLALTDITTVSYTGKAGQVLTVNSGESDAAFAALYKQNSQASASSITPTGDVRENEEYVTALAANLTINAPSGTPVNGNTLLIRIEDNGTSRTLTWNAIYEIVGTTLPTATTISKKMYVGCIYNSTDSKWDVVSVTEEV